jgi:hypothetical protein
MSSRGDHTDPAVVGVGMAVKMFHERFGHSIFLVPSGYSTFLRKLENIDKRITIIEGDYQHSENKCVRVRMIGMETGPAEIYVGVEFLWDGEVMTQAVKLVRGRGAWQFDAIVNELIPSVGRRSELTR